MGYVRAAVGVSSAGDTDSAVEEAVRRARAGMSGVDPALVFLTATVDHDASDVFNRVRSQFPGARIHGSTTSLGVLCPDGVVMGNGGAVGVLLVGGDGLDTHAGSAVIKDDPEAAGRAAAEALGDRSPAVLLFSVAPGAEEAVLRGVRGVLGDVPIFGGSAADHAIAGDWSVFTDDGPFRSAVSLVSIAGDVAVGAHFLSPYRPTEARAEVTGAQGRTITEIDGKPASETLHAWIGDSIAQQVEAGGNVLAQTAFRPLGLPLATSTGDRYLAIHPASIRAEDGAVNVFAQVPLGTKVCVMDGDAEGLIGALDTLIEEAKKAGGGFIPRAGFLIYCAGCAGAVGQALDAGLRDAWKRGLDGVPMLGLCSFGEQGTLPEIGPVHANLSMSLVLLGDR